MAKVGLENDILKQPKCPSNWEYSTGQRQLLDIQSGEQMDRLSFLFGSGGLRDYFDNPSKPPFDKGGFVLSFFERIFRNDIDKPPKPSFSKEGFVWSRRFRDFL